MITDVGKQLFDILDMANGTVKGADICAMVSTTENTDIKRYNNRIIFS